MAIRAPFMPRYSSGLTFDVNATANKINLLAGCKTLRIANAGQNVAYVRTYSSEDNVVANPSDLAVMPGERLFISKDQDHDALSCLSTLGTTLFVMQGEGGY